MNNGVTSGYVPIYGERESAHISNCHICYDFLAFGVVGVGFGNKGGSKATLTSVGDRIDDVSGPAEAEEFRRWEREYAHMHDETILRCGNR